MITMPKLQLNHRYIGEEIHPWLDLHFPEDSAYYGRTFIGQRHKGTSGIYNLSRRNIDELGDFVAEMHITPRLDYYITANSFSGVERNTEGVFGLHNIVVDVDCHSEDVEETPAELAQAFVWLCSRDLWTTGIMPEPNSIVMTGRGVQLWWALEPISVKLEWIYRRIQKWFVDSLEDLIDENAERLKGLSVDHVASKNIAGWFRLPLTFNTKAKRWGTLQIRKSDRYNHQELLDSIPADYKPSREKRRDVVGDQMGYVPLAASDPDVLQNGTSVMARRVYQLIRLRALRDAAKGDEMRDRFCFVVYCALLADHEPAEAWRRLLAFNKGFKEPLSVRKLAQMMGTAEAKGYKISNEWVIGELEITEAEQEAIGLHIVGSHAGAARRSNYTRDQIRAAQREDRDAKILSLFTAGQSKSAIARELGISRNTVGKIINAEIAAQTAARAAAENTTEAEQVAVGAEPAATSEQGVLKNGAYIYVSYAPSGAGMTGAHSAIKNIDAPSGGSG